MAGALDYHGAIGSHHINTCTERSLRGCCEEFLPERWHTCIGRVKLLSDVDTCARVLVSLSGSCKPVATDARTRDSPSCLISMPEFLALANDCSAATAICARPSRAKRFRNKPSQVVLFLEAFQTPKHTPSSVTGLITVVLHKRW